MKNDSRMGGRKISIPPTVLFSTIARMDDISQAITLDAKRDGDRVYVIGLTGPELGGSEYYAMHDAIGNQVPQVDPRTALRTYTAMAKTTDAGLCHSLHSPALGGLGVGFAKVAIGGQLGLDIHLDKIPVHQKMRLDEILFSESNSRFIATVPQNKAPEFEKILGKVPYAHVGKVKLDPILRLNYQGREVAAVSLDRLAKSYKSTLGQL